MVEQATTTLQTDVDRAAHDSRMTQDIKKLDRTSAHGDYLVTTRREVIEAHIDDAGIRIRWVRVAPVRRPLPFAGFEAWNQVFDANFEVGE